MKRLTTLLALTICLAFGAKTAEARKIWVPKKAWQSVKARAQSDLGKSRVRLYKSRFSNNMSKGLLSSAGKGAYLVHAKTERGAKGLYLVEKSKQGIYEAYPVTINQGKKHLSTMDARRPGSIQTRVTGGFPAQKTVHAVVVKNSDKIDMQLGNIVARGKVVRGKHSRLVFVLGSRNKGDSNAAAQLKMVPHGKSSVLTNGLTYGNVHFNANGHNAR